MASKNPLAPVCPQCGRSNGIWGEASISWTWRNGDWRHDDEKPDCLLDLTCGSCGYDGCLEDFEAPSPQGGE